jgi:N-acylneuraminate cytidylyltransferase
MKILALIPARGGSRGVLNKNIKSLAGRPLIQYTLDVAKQSKNLNKIVVSSDSEEIIAIATSLGAEVPFKRPGYLAKDNSTTLSVVRHALEYFLDIGEKFDAICLLQVTFPFRTVEVLEAALEKFILEKPDSLISVSKIPHVYNPHWAFEKNDSGFLRLFTDAQEIISRRQELPDTYFRNGSIYITKTEVVLNKNSLYGSKISYIELPREEVINIDTEEDWARAENYLNK